MSLGSFLGLTNNASVTVPTIDPNRFQYGGQAGRPAGDLHVAPGVTVHDPGQASGADAAKQHYGSMGQNAANSAAAQQNQFNQFGSSAQGRQGPQINQTNINQDRGNTAGLASLLDQAARGQGQSAAEIQMGKGESDAIASQLQLAAGARGPAALANAQYNAAGNVANLQATNNANAGILRAQEQAAARQQLGQLYQQQQGLDAQTAAQQAALEMQQRGLNDSTTLGAGQLGLGYANLGANTQMGYEKMGMGVDLAQLAAQEGLQGMITQSNLAAQGANAGISGENAQIGAGLLMGLLGAGAGVGNAVASDIRKKDDVKTASDIGRDLDAHFKGMSRTELKAASDPYAAGDPAVDRTEILPSTAVADRAPIPRSFYDISPQTGGYGRQVEPITGKLMPQSASEKAAGSASMNALGMNLPGAPSPNGGLTGFEASQHPELAPSASSPQGGSKFGSAMGAVGSSLMSTAQGLRGGGYGHAVPTYGLDAYGIPSDENFKMDIAPIGSGGAPGVGTINSMVKGEVGAAHAEEGGGMHMGGGRGLGMMFSDEHLKVREPETKHSSVREGFFGDFEHHYVPHGAKEIVKSGLARSVGPNSLMGQVGRAASFASTAIENSIARRFFDPSYGRVARSEPVRDLGEIDGITSDAGLKTGISRAADPQLLRTSPDSRESQFGGIGRPAAKQMNGLGVITSDKHAKEEAHDAGFAKGVAAASGAGRTSFAPKREGEMLTPGGYPRVREVQSQPQITSVPVMPQGYVPAAHGRTNATGVIIPEEMPTAAVSVAPGHAQLGGMPQAPIEPLVRGTPGGDAMYKAAEYIPNAVRQAVPPPPIIESDRRAKGGIHEGAADKFLDYLKPYTYRYKDPADEPTNLPTGGRYLGVMAQNVERAPEVGRTIVRDTPHGKVLDEGPLISALAAGVGRLHERVRVLEGQKKGRKV